MLYLKHRSLNHSRHWNGRSWSHTSSKRSSQLARRLQTQANLTLRVQQRLRTMQAPQMLHHHNQRQPPRSSSNSRSRCLLSIHDPSHELPITLPTLQCKRSCSKLLIVSWRNLASCHDTRRPSTRAAHHAPKASTPSARAIPTSVIATLGRRALRSSTPSCSCTVVLMVHVRNTTMPHYLSINLFHDIEFMNKPDEPYNRGIVRRVCTRLIE